jgi:hypothetical protein
MVIARLLKIKKFKPRKKKEKRKYTIKGDVKYGSFY